MEVHFMEVKLDLAQVALRTSQMSLLANVRQKREVLSIKRQSPTEIALEVVIEEVIGFGSIAPPRLQLRIRCGLPFVFAKVHLVTAPLTTTTKMKPLKTKRKFLEKCSFSRVLNLVPEVLILQTRKFAKLLLKN
jgi:hypothetical protein